MTAQALAEEFEVSLRTIHRDIDDLSAAGVPVYAERGRFGGFRLLDNYSTSLTGLTYAEIEALFLAGLPGPAADLGLGQASSDVKLKLLAAMPSDKRGIAERVASRFYLDPIGWYQSIEKTQHLQSLAAAVWEPRQIEVRYESWKDEVCRVLNPLGLVLKAGVWYLAAAAGASIRTYRVSKILSLRATGEGFARPDDFCLSEYWKEWASDFESRMFQNKAILKVSPEGVKQLSLLPFAAASLSTHAHAAPDANGWLTVEIPIESYRQAANDILRLGTDAEVIAPKELRRQVKKSASMIAALYSQ